jgi:hypothetical protein
VEASGHGEPGIAVVDDSRSGGEPLARRVDLGHSPASRDDSGSERPAEASGCPVDVGHDDGSCGGILGQ